MRKTNGRPAAATPTLRIAAFYVLVLAGATTCTSEGLAQEEEPYSWVRAHVPADIPLAKGTPPPDPRIWQAQPFCGPNCAYVLVAAAGGGLSHQEFIQKHFPESQLGLNMLELKEILNSHGIRSEVLEVGPAYLDGLPVPYIARLAAGKDAHHFVVVTKHDSDLHEYRVIDGTAGAKLSVPEADFHRDFTGYVLAQPSVIPWGKWVPRLLQLAVAAQVATIAALAFIYWRQRSAEMR